MHITVWIGVVVAAGAVIGAGCEKAATEPAKPVAATVPADLFLTAAPADAADVSAAKTAAREGDRVTLRGRIGGSLSPFTAERAVFTIIDPALPACSDNEGDSCETPWDYCCEPKEKIRANAATVQVVDASGAPLKTGLQGAGGLAPLSEVVVVGTVSQRDEGGTLVVNAEKIYVAAK